MDPAVIASYTRHYSKIPYLQDANRVEYTLCRTPQGLRLEVREVLGARRAAACMLPGYDPDYARGLLQFLYEHAIPVQSVCDIVQDLGPRPVPEAPSA